MRLKLAPLGSPYKQPFRIKTNETRVNFAINSAVKIMNFIFIFSLAASIIALSFTSPDGALPAMLAGANKALLLCFTLASVYSVWLGVFKILERAKITEKIARLMRRPVNKLFGNTSDKAAEYISLNLTANIMGMSGLATPLGIAACEELDKTNNSYAACMLFVLAATSLQILPTSVMALMSEYGSSAPSSIFLPSLLSTLVSTVSGAVMVRIFIKKPVYKSINAVNKQEKGTACEHKKQNKILIKKHKAESKV
mgnify:CR=1 FL=1